MAAISLAATSNGKGRTTIKAVQEVAVVEAEGVGVAGEVQTPLQKIYQKVSKEAGVVEVAEEVVISISYRHIFATRLKESKVGHISITRHVLMNCLSLNASKANLVSFLQNLAISRDGYMT